MALVRMQWAKYKQERMPGGTHRLENGNFVRLAPYKDHPALVVQALVLSPPTHKQKTVGISFCAYCLSPIASFWLPLRNRKEDVLRWLFSKWSSQTNRDVRRRKVFREQ